MQLYWQCCYVAIYSLAPAMLLHRVLCGHQEVLQPGDGGLFFLDDGFDNITNGNDSRHFAIFHHWQVPDMLIGHECQAGSQRLFEIDESRPWATLPG